ncbi:MAG: 50S ribosomal protein L13 [Thermoprotei archaeon ex4572_64]|nr:MAG: 50S ribosomal protein L13 [Thermoprotei archaeon ex4572_64]
MSSKDNVINVVKNPPSTEVIVDATNHVVGRLAAIVAKWLLEGRKVIIVNAEKAVITGDFNMVLNWYKRKITEWRTHYNPEKVGPKIPRRPDRILKRIVRGMLPRKDWRGRRALKRLKVYMSIPPEYIKRPRVVIVRALIKERPRLKYVTLEELWKHIEPHKYEEWIKAKEIWEKKLLST